ncbi:MAG: hypothetical protein EA001_12390 [Oscillatoriales cyanobacterium]|nr:MAG: hypothetical protein EA001_12390 [Oscillatoriales cyanobacterium]
MEQPGAIAASPDGLSALHPPLLAQHEVPDVVGGVQKFWNGLVKTGQLWALLIGMAVGYIICRATSYG